FFFLFTLPPTPISPLFPYTTLFRSDNTGTNLGCDREYLRAFVGPHTAGEAVLRVVCFLDRLLGRAESLNGNHRAKDLLLRHAIRSEEHTSELQSRRDLVCRLLLEKK